MKKFIYILLCSATAVFLGSCKSEPQEAAGKRFDTGKPYTEVLHKLKGYSISLQIASAPKVFKAGEETVVTYKLTNNGKKPLIIYEWMMNEEDNISLYHTVYSPDIKTFDKNAWNGNIPKTAEHPKRAPLTLNPNNSVFIEKKLKFIKDISPVELPESGTKYLLIAELNLSTVSARSQAVIITVDR